MWYTIESPRVSRSHHLLDRVNVTRPIDTSDKITRTAEGGYLLLIETNDNTKELTSAAKDLLDNMSSGL